MKNTCLSPAARRSSRRYILENSIARVCAAVLTAAAAHAASLTWSNGTANFIWDTTSLNWSGVAWPLPGADHDAVFGATGAGALTIDAGGVTANDLLFNAAGYSIGGGTLTLNGAVNNITTNADATISAVLAGTNGLTKLGAGQLTLNGNVSNIFTGTTIVDNGTLVLGKTGGAFAIIGNVQMGAGAAGNQPNLRMAANEQFGAGVVMTFVNPAGSYPRFDLQGTTQTLAGLSDGTGAGVVQNEKLGGGGTSGPATLTLNGAGTYSFNGYLRDRDNGPGIYLLNIVKNGNGTQTLAGGNVTYTGTTTVNGGVLEVLNDTAFASVATVNAGGTLRITNSSGSGPYSSLGGAAAIVVNSGGVLELNNATTGFGNRKTLGSTAPGTLGSAVSGAGTINVIGTGYLALPSVNNITLTGQINVQSGGLGNDSGNSANAFGICTAALNVSVGAYFDLRGGAPQFGGLSGAGEVINSYVSNMITLGAADGSGTFTGVMHDNGNAATDNINTGEGKTISLTKIGSGTQVLGVTNSAGSGITYTGTTTVGAGTLVIKDGRLVGGAKTVAAGATLEINSTIPFDIPPGSRWNNHGTISGAGIINKTGSGIFGTDGTVSFSGTINILDGRLHNDNVTGNWTGSTADVNISATGVLDLRANDIYVDELNGSGEVWNSHPAGGGDVLFVGVANGSSTYSGNILGNGSQAADNPNGAVLSLTKRGTGTFTSTGTNIYSGTTAVENGTLQFGAGGATGNIGTGAVTVNSPGTLVFNRSVTANITSSVSGNGNLIQAGSGTTVLTNASYTGATSVTGGTLALVNPTAASSSAAISAGATLAYYFSAPQTFTTPTSGAGRFIKLGAGDFTIGVNLAHSGDTSIRAGAAFVDAASRLSPTSALTLGGPVKLNLSGFDQTTSGIAGSRDSAASIVGGGAANATFTANITSGQNVFGGNFGGGGANENNLAVVKQGAGTLVLTGASTHTGGLTIAGGTVQLGASTTMPLAASAFSIWLDGTDPAATGTAPANGSAISMWKNKGTLGAGGDFAAPGGSEPAYNTGGANPVVSFTADNVPNFDPQTNYDRLSNAIDLTNGASTVIVVGRYASGNAGERNRLVSARGNNWLLGWWNNGVNGAYYNNGFVPFISAADTSFHTYTAAIRGDGTGDTYNETGRIGSGAAEGANGLSLGGGYLNGATENSTGDIGEVFIVQGDMADRDRAAIEAYLARKWTGFLPVNPLPTTGTVNLSASGATLAVNGVTQTLGSVSGVAGTGIALGGGSLTVGNDGGSAAFAGVISGGGTLAKTGGGTWTLSGANTYTAPTSVRNGTLALSGGANRLPVGTTVDLGTAATSGTLKLGGNSQTVAGLTSGLSTGGAGSRVVNDSATPATLTVNLTAGTNSFSGKLGGTTANENNLALRKEGAGTLALTNASTYTGATVIAGGTILLGGATALRSSAAIWLDATDGATINTDGNGVLSWTNKGTLGASGDFAPAVAGLQQPGFVPSEPALGGNSVIHFSSANNDRLQTALNFANNVTVAYVGRLSGGANERLVSATGNNWLLGTWGGSQEAAYFTNGFLYNAGTPDTAARFFTGTIAADGTSAFYSNGNLLGTGSGASGPNGLQLGGGYLNTETEFSDGDIGEVFVFNGVLSAADRARLDSYIAWKWFGGAASNILPTGTAVSLTGSGATLDVNGSTQTVGSVSSVAGSTIALGGGTLTVGGDGSTTTVAGAITGGGTLTKEGAGTLTITGTQTYDTLNANGGITNVNSALGTGTSVLNASATVNIHASQTLAALNIADGVEVTFGDGLPFAGVPEKAAGFRGSVGVVPEPGAVALLLVGALGLCGRRRMRVA